MWTVQFFYGDEVIYVNAVLSPTAIEYTQNKNKACVVKKEELLGVINVITKEFANPPILLQPIKHKNV